MMVICDCLLDPLCFVMLCRQQMALMGTVPTQPSGVIRAPHCPWLFDVIEKPIWTFQTVDPQEVNFEKAEFSLKVTIENAQIPSGPKDKLLYNNELEE